MIKGKKVLLREKRLDDALQDYAWKTDPELARLDATLPLNVPFKTYLLTYAEELDRRVDGKGRVFAVETLEGKHIGNCCYYNMEWDRREAEVGILIGDPAYWDDGYGTDAVRALVDHVFRKEGLKKVYLHTLVWNTTGPEVLSEVRVCRVQARQEVGLRFHSDGEETAGEAPR